MIRGAGLDFGAMDADGLSAGAGLSPRSLLGLSEGEIAGLVTAAGLGDAEMSLAGLSLSLSLPFPLS